MYLNTISAISIKPHDYDYDFNDYLLKVINELTNILMLYPLYWIIFVQYF